MFEIRSMRPQSKIKTIKFTVFFIILGMTLGVFSKYLDTMAINELPFLFEKFDITNFLGRFSIWIFIAMLISIFPNSPYRSAIYILNNI